MNKTIINKIEASIARFSELNPDLTPTVVLLDDESYFELKLSELGSFDAAISFELETVLGLRVFYNRLGYTYIDVV